MIVAYTLDFPGQWTRTIASIYIVSNYIVLILHKVMKVYIFYCFTLVPDNFKHDLHIGIWSMFIERSVVVKTRTILIIWSYKNNILEFFFVDWLICYHTTKICPKLLLPRLFSFSFRVQVSINYKYEIFSYICKLFNKEWFGF